MLGSPVAQATPGPRSIVHCLHVGLVDLKALEVEVLPHAFRVQALGQDCISVLHAPAKQELGFGYAVLSARSANAPLSVFISRSLRWPVPLSRATSKAAQGCCRQSARCLPGHVGDEFRFLRPGMQFDLVGVGRLKTCCPDFLQMGVVEIADADGAGLAGFLKFDECPPLGQALRSAIGRVDQIEIDIIKAEPFQACLALGNCLVMGLRRVAPGRIAGPQLGGDEEIAPRQAGRCQARPDTLADRLLVAITRGGINMAIPCPMAALSPRARPHLKRDKSRIPPRGFLWSG